MSKLMLLIAEEFWFHLGMSNQRSEKGVRTWLQLAVILFAVVALIGAIIQTLNPVAKRANLAATASNCKRICTALRIYAGDHGRYPDTVQPGITTANQAFRELIRAGVLEDERIFGAMVSPFFPDGKIGMAPDFNQALEAGENHWAMTKGLTDASRALTPMVFENPSATGWPPKWNTAAASKAVRGRVWRDQSIIVGFADSSVAPLKMESKIGTAVPPQPDASGKDTFTRAAPTGSILDIEP